MSADIRRALLELLDEPKANEALAWLMSRGCVQMDVGGDYPQLHVTSRGRLWLSSIDTFSGSPA